LIAVACETAPFFVHGWLTCLEVAAAAQAGHHFDNDGGSGESSDSRSEVRVLCSLLSLVVSNPR